MNHAPTTPGEFRRGFTLVELLAAMILFSMIIGMTAWAVIGATDTTAGAEKQMDTTMQARAFLDRFGADLNNMMDEGGLTAFYCDAGGAGDNSAIGFVCRSRPRATSGDMRGIVAAYRINEIEDIDGLKYPMASRGDCTLLYDDQVGSIIEESSGDLDDGGNVILNWQVIGTGIIRLHISFLLNDGSIVQIPPTYKLTASAFPDGFTLKDDCKFIPFRAEDSVNGTYVVGMTVGIAVLDPRTRNLAGKDIGSYANQFARPVADGETPNAVWNKKLETLGEGAIPKPFRANIRFYERMYTVR
jgi:prepilin-type N-terminal cleavage/methylation domain-containing protein